MGGHLGIYHEDLLTYLTNENSSGRKSKAWNCRADVMSKPAAAELLAVTRIHSRSALRGDAQEGVFPFLILYIGITYLVERWN